MLRGCLPVGQQAGGGHDALEVLHKPGVVLGQRLQLVVHPGGGRFLQQRLPLPAGHRVHRVVHKVHVDADGPDARRAELDPDGLPGQQLGSVGPVQRRLSVLRRSEFHQTPALDHSVLHGDLRKRTGI